MTQYTGHSARHDGLQGHSLGEFYPIITTQYGDGSHGLIFGGYELRGNTPDRNREVRATLHCVYELQGWSAALSYFENIVRANPIHAR